MSERDYIKHILVISIIFMAVTALYFRNQSGLFSANGSAPASVSIDPGIIVIRDEFNGATTLFRLMNDTELANISNMTIEVASYGKIFFLPTANITADAVSSSSDPAYSRYIPSLVVDIDKYTEIISNNITVNVTGLTSFNKTVTINLIGLTFTDPSPVLNGFLCTSCTEISYDNSTGNYSFQASFNAGTEMVSFSAGEASEVPIAPTTPTTTTTVTKTPTPEEPLTGLPKKPPVPEKQPLDLSLIPYDACEYIAINTKANSDFIQSSSAVLQPNSEDNGKRFRFQEFNASSEYQEIIFGFESGGIPVIVFDLKGGESVGYIDLDIAIPRSVLAEKGIDSNTLTLIHRFSDEDWRSGGGQLFKIGEDETNFYYTARIDKSAFGASLFAVGGGSSALLCQLCESGEWSECSSKQQSRLYAECGDHTGFTCRPMTQNRLCGAIIATPDAPPPLEPLLFVAVAIGISSFVIIRAISRRKEISTVTAAIVLITISFVSGLSISAGSFNVSYEHPAELITGSNAFTESSNLLMNVRPQVPLLTDVLTQLPIFEYLPDKQRFRVTVHAQVTSQCAVGKAESYFIYSFGGEPLTGKTTSQVADIPSEISAEIPTVRPGELISYSAIIIDRKGLPIYGGRIDIYAPGIPEPEYAEEIGITVDVPEKEAPAGRFFEILSTTDSYIVAGSSVEGQINITNRGDIRPVAIELEYGIMSRNETVITSQTEYFDLFDQVSLDRKIKVPMDIKQGYYYFYAAARSEDSSVNDVHRFYVYILEAEPGVTYPTDIFLIFVLYIILLALLLLAYYKRHKCYICKKRGVKKCDRCERFICKKHCTVHNRKIYCKGGCRMKERA